MKMIQANKYRNIKCKLFFFLVLLLNMNSYSQESYFNYSPIKITQAKAIEEQYNATQYFPTYKIYNPDKVYELERPWFFKRPKSGDSESVTVQYSFSKKDSIVRRIEYAWEVKNEKSKSRFFEHYKIKFDKIVDRISRDIGEPNAGLGSIEEKEDEIEVDGYRDRHFERTVIWENEKQKVSTTLLWSKEHGTLFYTVVFFK